MNKILITLSGPTASGKTTLSIRIAKALGAEIFSCDSRQFYKEMSIGTAVPSETELKEVPHHFIQHKSIQSPYSVGQFEADAMDALMQYFEKQDFAVLVGGSGLYMHAVVEGIDKFPEVPEEIRTHLGNVWKAMAWRICKMSYKDLTLIIIKKWISKTRVECYVLWA